MESIKKISRKQIIGLTTRIDELNIPMLGKSFFNNLRYNQKISDSLCTNSKVWFDLNESMIIFFYTVKEKKMLVLIIMDLELRRLNKLINH